MSSYISVLNHYLVNRDGMVRMKFNKKFLKHWLIQSTWYIDDSGLDKLENLIIEFPLAHLTRAKEIFDTFSDENADMDSLNYTDLVSVESKSPGCFQKIRLTIHRNGSVYIHFSEKHSCIVYELQLDSTLYTRVKTENVETQDVECEILIQGCVLHDIGVPTTIINEGEDAIVDWIRTNIQLNELFEKNELECLVDLRQDEV